MSSGHAYSIACQLGYFLQFLEHTQDGQFGWCEHRPLVSSTGLQTEHSIVTYFSLHECVHEHCFVRVRSYMLRLHCYSCPRSGDELKFTGCDSLVPQSLSVSHSHSIAAHVCELVVCS